MNRPAVPLALLALTLLWTCAGPQKAADVTPEESEEVVISAEPLPEAEMDKAADMEAQPAELAEPMLSAKTMAAGAPASPPRAPSPTLAKEKGKKADKVTTWKRSTVVPNTSRLAVGDNEYLPLVGTQVHVRIDGFRARVVIDSFFYNDRGQQFEGTFKLRLPTGGSPYFFAFGETEYKTDEIQVAYLSQRDIQKQGVDSQQIMKSRQGRWTAPKEARMVTKEKAAFAYGETVRRRVDPALMEWSGAGIFNARVFPLAPDKTHRIVVGYDVDLTAAGDDLELRLDLPQEEARKVDRVVDLDVAEVSGVTTTVSPAVEPLAGRGRRLYRFANPQEKTITVRLAKPGPLLLTGRDAETGAYFAADLMPDLPAGAARGSSHGVFLLDTSLSSNPDAFNVWLALTKAILSANRGTLERFAVLFFDIEASWWRQAWTANTPENVEALMSRAGTLSLEGGTDVGVALREAARPIWLGPAAGLRWDVFLLSDGAVTWGEADLQVLSASLEQSRVSGLFAYTTGMAGTNTRVLGHLTREGGGAVFSVVGEEEVAKAATAHRTRPWRLESVHVQGGSDLLLAGRPQVLFAGQRLRLAGRGDLQPGVTVELAVERDGERKTIATKIRRGLRSETAPRIYGQIAVEQLEELASATEELSKAYGCHFRVTGKTCSLLMLESEEDYQRFDIVPEDLAQAVKQRPASVVVAQVLKQVGDALGDPKAGFIAWLDKMITMPGFSLRIEPALREAIDRMPRSAFRVHVPPLAVEERTWSAVGRAARKQLATRRLEYDTFVKEAERRRKTYGAGDGLRALSSLVENKPGDAVLARDIGFTAMAWGLRGQAYHIFRRVAESRPHEPQTYRALATVLAEMGYADQALAYYEIGLAGQWDSRFGEYRRILALDYLRFLRRIKTGEIHTSVVQFANLRLRAVAKQFEVASADLLVSITWNTDGTDVDLHVIEPSGEECYYSHPTTKQGGRLTEDVTQGYGPEMYLLPKAKQAGTYRVKVNYFASDANRASARTKIYAALYQNWGTKREKRTQKVVTLEYGKQMHDIATLVVR